MWLQRLTNFLLKRRWQTLLLTFLITFVPIIGIVGILIAALVTLVEGIATGTLLTIAATLPYFISTFITSPPQGTIPLVVWAAISVAVLSNLLTYAFAIMLRRNSSWSLIIQTAALLGVLVVSVIHLVYPNVTEWWGHQLQAYYNHAQAMVGTVKGLPNSLTNDSQLETINITKDYATGLMVAAILFNALLQLIAARWWQAMVFKPGSLQKELHEIRLSQLAGVLFMGSIILSYLGNLVVLDIMPILYLLFGTAGLSLIHYFFKKMKSQTAWFWLMLTYLAIIFVFPTSIVFIAMFALFDIWLDFRKRFAKI